MVDLSAALISVGPGLLLPVALSTDREADTSIAMLTRLRHVPSTTATHARNSNKRYIIIIILGLGSFTARTHTVSFEQYLDDTDTRNNKTFAQTLDMLIREKYQAGAIEWSRLLDALSRKTGEEAVLLAAQIPTLVDGSKLTLHYPIRVEIGQQRVAVLTCWAWLRHIKQDSFLFAILSGQGGWTDQQQFLNSITEKSPVPVLHLMPLQDSHEDKECVHLHRLFALVRAQAFDADPLITTEEAKKDPDYKSATTDLMEQMTVEELINVIALADQYGI